MANDRNTPTPTYAPCPNCKSVRARIIPFTWWGGVIGPRMLTHVKCLDCGTAFNGKTGRYNTNAIIIYNLVALAVGILLLVLFASFR
jgi:hypothetical protein